jgi:chromosome segregation ATPase
MADHFMETVRLRVSEIDRRIDLEIMTVRQQFSEQRLFIVSNVEPIRETIRLGFLRTFQELGALKDRADGHEVHIDGLGLRMDQLDGRMDRLDSRMDQLEVRMDRLEGRMAQLEGRMDRLELRMDVLEDRMEGLEDRMDRLEGRMDRLEAKLDAHFTVVRDLLLEISRRLPPAA